jgi:hypothetical protein
MHPRHLTGSLRALAGVGAIALVLAACSVATSVSQPSGGGGPSAAAAKPPFIPQIISSESVVGPSRFVFGILDPSATRTVASPDLKISVAFTPVGGSTSAPGGSPAVPIAAAPATFIWAIQGERGIYVIEPTFPSAGHWDAAFSTDGGTIQPPSPAGSPAATALTIPVATVTVNFDVKQTGSAVPVGGKAPATKTPTATTPDGIARIATDPNPDPSFYTTSVDEALAKHEPFVLVFATPAFCTSRQCGPTLDAIKAVAKSEPGIVFINVEPYQLQYVGGHLEPILDANNQLQPTDVVRAWGILSEPWAFVVDRDGVVRASFETVVSPDELKAAIAAVR